MERNNYYYLKYALIDIDILTKRHNSSLNCAIYRK